MQQKEPDWPGSIIRSYGYQIYLLIFLLNLLWNGFSSVDGFAPPSALTALTSTAENPFACQLEKNYYREAPFYFLLAHWAGATTPREYLLFCGVAVTAVHLAFLFSSVRTLGKENGIMASLLFLAHPVTYIMNSWLGMVDPVTVSCTIVLLFTRRFLPVLAAAALSRFNHPATTFIVPCLLMLQFVASPKDASIPTLMAGGIGLAIGKILCYFTYMFYTFPVYTRWVFFMTIPLRRWLEFNFSHFSLCLYSFGFALWIPLLVVLLAQYTRDRRLVIAYGFAMAGLYAVTFFTLDTTRVFAILSWAPTLYMLITYFREPSPGSRPPPGIGATIRWSALLGWLAPHLFIWEGRVYSPGVREMLRFLRAIYSR